MKNGKSGEFMSDEEGSQLLAWLSRSVYKLNPSSLHIPFSGHLQHHC